MAAELSTTSVTVEADVVKGDAAHAESHGGAGSNRVKSIVFGGLDGVITTFSIVAAVAGADLPPQTAILMGFSNLIADALSMGLGDFLSSKAELEFELSESNREKVEFEKDPEHEVAEHARMLVKRGVSEADAMSLSTTLAKYPDVRCARLCWRVAAPPPAPPPSPRVAHKHASPRPPLSRAPRRRFTRCTSRSSSACRRPTARRPPRWTASRPSCPSSFSAPCPCGRT